MTACTGVLHSRTFPKLTGVAAVLSRTRLSLFAILCPKHSFTFLSTSVIIKKVAVKYGCLGTSGVHHWEFVLDILESLYFYNFFLHRMSDVSFSCLMFGIILWLFCKYWNVAIMSFEYSQVPWVPENIFYIYSNFMCKYISCASLNMLWFMCVCFFWYVVQLLTVLKNSNKNVNI